MNSSSRAFDDTSLNIDMNCDSVVVLLMVSLTDDWGSYANDTPWDRPITCSNTEKSCSAAVL